MSGEPWPGIVPGVDVSLARVAASKIAKLEADPGRPVERHLWGATLRRVSRREWKRIQAANSKRPT
jgi:hypothetical protein